MAAEVDRSLLVEVTCRDCRRDLEFRVDPADRQRWRDSELIQRAMPYLSIEERELLISGICSRCFDALFADDDDHDDIEGDDEATPF